jgi:Asp-tRNA(Asn)/Glu-tRNA(Gln) amidotransferase A subunit family amidase
MPVALQIIGGQREDLIVLKAMHAFESVLNFNLRATDHEGK